MDWDTIDLDQVLGFAFAPTELDAPRWVSSLMQMNVEVRVSMVAFHRGGEAFKSHRNPPPSEGQSKAEWLIEDQKTDRQQLAEGTFLILKSGNENRWKKIIATLKRLSRNSSIELQPLFSGRNPKGPDLGSSRIVLLPKCNPALIVGAGTNANSAGALWHFLDHRMEQPTTLIDAERISRVALSDFSCIVIPAGGLDTWGKREATALESYVQQGGTMIASESSIDWLHRNGILKLQKSSASDAPESEAYDGSQPQENATAETSGAVQKSAQTSKTNSKNSLRFGDAQEAAALETVAGAFFMTRIDPTHPLGFGFPDEWVPVFRDSSTTFAFPPNHFQVAAHYEHVIAGYVSSKNRNRIKETPAVWAQPLGKGHVIMIADSPVFRGYIRSSERFLTNAMLIGPVLRIPPMPSK
jgi:hypothetical protein